MNPPVAPRPGPALSKAGTDTLQAAPGDSSGTPLRRTAAVLWKRIAVVFSLDLRSLALFRIGIGFMLLADLAIRSMDLKAHYTDAGVLPREALLGALSSSRWHLSLHWMSGELWAQSLLFGLAALCALCLMAGYRTWLATLLSWFLLISLQNRNPLVLNAGDMVLRLVLFWSLFLPLGAYFSADRAMRLGRERIPGTVLSVGGVALILQIIAIYWFSALLKTDPIWHTEFSATYYALSIEHFTRPLGKVLLEFPNLLIAATMGTYYLEKYGVFLVLLPFWNTTARLVLITTFVSFHLLGLATTMTFGPFPYTCAVAWLIFLPGKFWDRIGQWSRAKGRNAGGTIIFFDRDCGFCRRMVCLLRTFLCVSAARMTPAQERSEIFAEMERLNSWIVVDRGGDAHVKFEGFIQLCRLSPWAFAAVPLLTLAPVRWLGTRAYECVARRRALLSWTLRWLRFHRAPLVRNASLWVNLLAGALLLYVLLWNIRTVESSPAQIWLSHRYNYIGETLRLDQRWGMFAPSPFRDNGWYVIPGLLWNGTEVDLFRNGSPVHWEKPASIASMYRSDRWRNYMIAIYRDRGKGHRPYFGSYLCREWNARHRTRGTRLHSFDICYMLERNATGTAKEPLRKVVLWSHECAPAAPAAKADSTSEKPGPSDLD